MKNRYRFTILITLILSFSCTSEKTLFEMESWWSGHWQDLNDPQSFFSIGSRPVGAHEIITPQFFISTYDSILANFYMKSLDDFDHKKRYKIIKTSEETFIKIQEIDEDNIEVFGPGETLEELNLKISAFSRFIPADRWPKCDSILDID